jgi:hypothetical protein
MTVCVTAISSSGTCLVCVADKALSYGDYLQWDSDTTKIIPLPSKRGVLMVSGGEDASRVVNQILALSDLGQDIAGTIAKLEATYQRCYDEVLEIKFVKQNGLTRAQYVAAISGPQINRHIEAIAEDIRAFRLDCDLIVCGHDQNRQPFILSVASPGKVVDLTREGFHAIGNGFDHALSRLLMVDHERKDGVVQTLYDCFDAKAHAEMAAGVGYEWDAYLVTDAGSVPMDPDMKPIIDRVWAKANRSPFDKRKKDDLPNPPTDWPVRLAKMAAAMFRKLGIATFDDAEVVWPDGSRAG